LTADRSNTRPKLTSNVSELIGNTPLIQLKKMSPIGGASILAKLEFLNPGGSVKDRIALAMLVSAEQKGELQDEVTVVEATSGNTGIALAMLCAERNHKLILTMPETMSFERRSLVARYGAEVILTPGSEDIAGAVRRAQKIIQQNPRCIGLRQWDNPANPEFHRQTTAQEILNAVEGPISAFVAGVGTGGTITGVGEVLKSKFPDIKIVAVEPDSSAVLSGKKPGRHSIEGIGPGFIPSILNRDIIDEIITISDQSAFETSKNLASEEALLVGISSGAAVYAAQQVAKHFSPEEVVITVIPDTGTRYFSVEKYLERELPNAGGILL
jgi:cysteine synthase A